MRASRNREIGFKNELPTQHNYASNIWRNRCKNTQLVILTTAHAQGLPILCSSFIGASQVQYTVFVRESFQKPHFPSQISPQQIPFSVVLYTTYSSVVLLQVIQIELAQVVRLSSRLLCMGLLTTLAIHKLHIYRCQLVGSTYLIGVIFQIKCALHKLLSRA